MPMKRSRKEDYRVEKNLSLNYEEATALLQMSLFSYLDDTSEASENALRKLGDFCREFPLRDEDTDRETVSHELARAA